MFVVSSSESLPIESDFRLSKRQLWLFRISIYSIPICFFCVAVYCLVKNIPNPRSVVPKFVLEFVTAVTFGLYASSWEMILRSSKSASQERRKIFYGGFILVALFWIAILIFRNNTQFNLTGDGEPTFRILWFVMGICHWSICRSKYRNSPEPEQ